MTFISHLLVASTTVSRTNAKVYDSHDTGEENFEEIHITSHFSYIYNLPATMRLDCVESGIYKMSTRHSFGHKINYLSKFTQYSETE